MANGEKRMIPEDRMERKKVSKRRQTGTTAKDDIELFQSPPSSPLLTPKSSHLTSSLEAPSQLQTPLSSPPSSRPPSPNPVDVPYLTPLPTSRPPTPISIKEISNTNVTIITIVTNDHSLIDDEFITQDSIFQQQNRKKTSHLPLKVVNSSIPPCARCPTELIYHVFEILRTLHQPSLFSCILVNHQWNAIGTNVLWNSPKFTHMQHDRNNASLSSHLLRLLPLIHTENLHTLNLSFVKGITNGYLTKLLSPFFNNVRTLNLAGGSRSDTCLSSIIPNCGKVQNLSLAWNTSLSDASINKIATICGDRLRTLDLTNCEKVSDRSMHSISRYCLKLRELRVSYCRGVSEEGVRDVIEACEGLKLLDLVGCLGVDKCFLLKCNDEFGLAKRELKVIWRRFTDVNNTWTDEN
ncbi:12994_t:CDS:2 [Funneliformis caledonium]|uniref:12994_t:CDS:1 n=1 Tax=Funneliformis caledonium TaxID=1117310 RepID=A0A9N9AWF3_9GLOM|nr:12994_t:CDS:2 [Funneliformis caledonium]